jgi:uncharacterized protein (DUF427 family)
MSLTVGSGPFGHRPSGTFDFERPAHVVYVEDSPRRVRAVKGSETVVASRRVRLLHETGSLPVFYFPEEDVRLELLPEAAIRRHEAVPGHLTVDWDAPDAWFEEEEELHGHPRDPFHRIDVRESSRHVRVLVLGELVAESRRPRVLFETGLPTRYYLRPENVRLDLLVPHGKRTRCAYKGVASHWSVRVRGELAEAVAWIYTAPDDDGKPIKGLIAFYNELVDLEVDGEREERPRTQWHPDGWAEG